MNKIFTLLLILFALIADAQNTSAIRVGDSLYALGAYSQALKFYKEAGDQEQKIARTYDAIGNTTRALEFYEKALSGNKPTLLTQYNYGKLLLKAGQYPEADSLFNKLTQSNGENPEFYYQLGLAKGKLQDSTAFLSFSKALRLDENHQNTLYKLAKYRAEKRNFNGAMEYVENGLQTDQNSIRFLYLKAVIAYVNKNYHTASETYEKLLELNQTSEQLHKNLAVSYTQTNRFEAAIQQYTILINEYDDKNPSWHYSIAKNFEALRYLDKAQHHFEVAIVLQDIPLDDSYFALAGVFKKQKEYKGQMEALQKAVQENPENQAALYFLAAAADDYFEDDASVIPYYETYLKKFGEKGKFSEFAKQRIKDIKTDIHFNKN